MRIYISNVQYKICAKIFNFILDKNPRCDFSEKPRCEFSETPRCDPCDLVSAIALTGPEILELVKLNSRLKRCYRMQKKDPTDTRDYSGIIYAHYSNLEEAVKSHLKTAVAEETNDEFEEFHCAVDELLDRETPYWEEEEGE